MHRVGFEPTKHDAIELESIPFDQLGNLCLTIKFKKNNAPPPVARSLCKCQVWDLNPRSVSHQILSLTPLTRLGYPCLSMTIRYFSLPNYLR